MSVTSGTTAFSLDVDDIIYRALLPLGGEETSGIEASEARDALNLLLIELQNKNIPLNKIDTVSLPLLVDTFEYTLDASIVDVLEATVSQGSDIDIPVERWGVKDFHEIPNKTTKQRPTIFTTDRGSDNVIIKFWPMPEKAYTAKLLVAKKVEDITSSYQKVDLSTRYLPLVIKWLSYELALTRPNVVNTETLAMLKLRLDETMPDTFEEDRERVNMNITLGGISGK